MHSDIVVGIDLGTTNSVVAAVVDGRLEVVRDPDGNALVPSVVAFMPDGQKLVGRRARERRIIDAPNTIFSAKRIIGRPFNADDTQGIIMQLPYRVVGGENEEPLIETRAGTHSVVDIAATVLGHLKIRAEQQLGRRVRGCVVTVPANFSDGQREATRRAVEAAGMDALRIINEPTAAAVALGYAGTEARRVAVFDLGGGTFDVTVLSIHDNLFEVLATGGEPYLGGDDFDRALAESLSMNFLRQHRLDLRADAQSRSRVLALAEEIKAMLSRTDFANGSVPDIAYGVGGSALALDYAVSRGEFEALIRPHVDKAMAVTRAVLAEARLGPEAIDDVALVGGSTLIPAVREAVAQLFGRAPNTGVNPLEVVATGAARQAHSLWSVANDDVEDFSESALLMDVTSHALGVATFGDNVQVLIPKNTPIPCESSSVFSTVEHGQTEVRIRVCQGEHPKFSQANQLGEVRLTGLRPAARGEISIEVEFLVDANGIVQVSARDVASGREANAVLSVLGIKDAG